MIRVWNTKDTDAVKSIQLVLDGVCQRPGFTAIEKDWLDVDMVKLDFSRNGNTKSPDSSPHQIETSLARLILWCTSGSELPVLILQS